MNLHEFIFEKKGFWLNWITILNNHLVVFITLIFFILHLKFHLIKGLIAMICFLLHLVQASSLFSIVFSINLRVLSHSDYYY